MKCRTRNEAVRANSMNISTKPELRFGSLRFPARMEAFQSPIISVRKFWNFYKMHVASGLRAISKITPARERNAAYWLYLKFVSRLFTLPFIPSGRVSRERVMGADLRVLDYGTFLTLISEIFFRRIYYFESDSLSPVILDAGSNIGMSILFFKHIYRQCRIIGFEPDPRTFEILQGNVLRNHWENVEVFNKALHATDGEIDFYTDANRAGSGRASALKERFSASAGQAVRCQAVKAVPLSRFVVKEVDLLKMDIEGSEGEVIQELSDANKLRSIKQILVEYHHHLKPDEDRLSQFLRVLEQNGFGYQVSSEASTPFKREVIQPILIYAYRRD
jgi:FkbM family methyltransferase